MLLLDIACVQLCDFYINNMSFPSIMFSIGHYSKDLTFMILVVDLFLFLSGRLLSSAGNYLLRPFLFPNKDFLFLHMPTTFCKLSVLSPYPTISLVLTHFNCS